MIDKDELLKRVTPEIVIENADMKTASAFIEYNEAVPDIFPSLYKIEL